MLKSKIIFVKKYFNIFSNKKHFKNNHYYNTINLFLILKSSDLMLPIIFLETHMSMLLSRLRDCLFFFHDFKIRNKFKIQASIEKS